MRTTWGLPASCTYCGNELTPVNNCVPSQTLAVAIVRCEPCGREWEMTARLTERRRTTRDQRRAVA